VFERFTERARQVVVSAQEEARAFNHNYIGTEHLLLGLLREEEGLAAKVLAGLGVTLAGVRRGVEGIVGRGPEPATGQIPFTPRAKAVLEHSLREALSIGHNHIGTEHILLGLARERAGVACRILLDLDIDGDRVRGAVLEALGPEVQQRTRTWSGRLRRGAPHVALTPGRRAHWEYSLERREALDEDAATWLNDRGAEGWELTAILPVPEGITLVLKRQRSPLTEARTETA
jgi:ATP-dependent Clp protease ATP-binding subunit ClpA